MLKHATKSYTNPLSTIAKKNTVRIETTLWKNFGLKNLLAEVGMNKTELQRKLQRN